MGFKCEQITGWSSRRRRRDLKREVRRKMRRVSKELLSKDRDSEIPNRVIHGWND